MTPPIAPADTYGLVVPAEWTEVPLEPTEFDAYRDAVLSRMAELDGWNKTTERKLDLLLSQVYNDLRMTNTRMAAVYAESEETDEGLAITLAAVSVSRVDKSSLGLRVPLTPDTLLMALGREPRKDSKIEYTNLEPPSLVDLPAGSAVHLRRHYRVSPAPAELLEYYAEAYLVPHDDGEAICTVQFSTPNVEDGSVLSGLFSAIARTLRIFMPGDPTDFSDPAPGG